MTKEERRAAHSRRVAARNDGRVPWVDRQENIQAYCAGIDRARLAASSEDDRGTVLRHNTRGAP
jgi:hypothetical protein